MIIGYDFFGLGVNGNVFDTAIPTSQIDELKMGAGIYDELFISVDTDIDSSNVKPTTWAIKNIMHAKFQEDLEGGTLDADGHIINRIQVYRKPVSKAKGWLLIGQFDYSIDFNAYAFTDITAENGVTYEYAIVPVANTILGSMTTSQPVKAEYEGVFISDLKSNYKMELDLEVGAITYNRNMAVMTPLNGAHPVVTYGNQNYRSGNIKFLEVSKEQRDSGGKKIDGRKEYEVRSSIVNFLNNGVSKIIRNDNGEVMVIATSGVKSTPKKGALQNIHDLEFNFIELGELSYSTLSRAGLIGDAVAFNYSFDEDGEIIWDI